MFGLYGAENYADSLLIGEIDLSDLPFSDKAKTWLEALGNSSAME